MFRCGSSRVWQPFEFAVWCSLAKLPLARLIWLLGVLVCSAYYSVRFYIGMLDSLSVSHYATERLVLTGEFFFAHVYACGGNYRQCERSESHTSR